MTLSKILILALMLFSYGCRVGQQYIPPSTPVAEDWKFNSAEITRPAPCVENWWEVFQDSILNELEQSAVENNPNLFSALGKVFEARALAGVEAANLYPQIFLNPSITSTGMLFKIQLPPQFALPGVPTQIPPFRIHQMQYILPLNLNYELDLWGKLRDRLDAAIFNAEAEAESYCSALLTLTADLAVAYFNLRSFDAQIELLTANIETRTKNYNITKARYDKGLVTYLDVAQSETDLANVKASYYSAIRQRNLAEDQIAVLAGENPSLFCLQSNPLKEPPPQIPPDMPATVLLRRPDLRAAERTMASQFALVNSAYAEFFPNISLTGVLGFFSPDSANFMKWKSRYWSMGASDSQMVFDGGRDYYNWQAARARFGEASGDYQGKVLTAFQEVENVLNDVHLQSLEGEQLLHAVQASTKATELSMERYTRGIAIYLEVVDNERLKLQAQINYVNVLGLRYVSTVQLIKALGGSWDCSSSALLEPPSEEPCSNAESEKSYDS